MKFRKFMQIIMVILIATLGLQVGQAYAISLDQAKAQGLVGEMPNGYLGAVHPSPAVNMLVAQINTQRRVYYAQIAAKNRTSVKAVEAIAGKTAIEKTPTGYYVKTPQGAWVRKR